MKTEKINHTIKRISATIVQEDIENAKRANSRHCMIQEAFKRKYPKLKAIYVDKNLVRVTDSKNDLIYTFQMSPLGRAAILKWDMGETVPPFKVSLKNPVIRKRSTRYGAKRPEGAVGAAHNIGAVPRPKNKQQARTMGRDRVFGAKLFGHEITQLRQFLGTNVSQPSEIQPPV